MSRTVLGSFVATAACILAFAQGCPPASVGPAFDFAGCIAEVEKTEPPTATALTRVLDAVVACGGDLPSIFGALAKSHAKDPAFLAELVTLRAEHDANPAAFRTRLRAAMHAPGDVRTRP